MAYGPAPYFSPEQDVEVSQRYKDGESILALAAQEGVGRKVVENALNRQGVQRRGRLEAVLLAADRQRATGMPHPNFKGGRVKVGGGYRGCRVPNDDPMIVMAYDRRTHYGYVLEHRLVMARSLGRPLTSTESVHHKNGKRDDNRLENLQMRQGKHGNGQRHVCADCGSHNIVPATLD